MTKKDKIKAYRKGAELIRTYEVSSCFGSMYKQGVFINRELDVFIYDSTVPFESRDLQETILLSCAELVRLDFKI